MKYKISAVAITSFLIISCILYIYNCGAFVFDAYKENGANASGVKAAILKIRDADAQQAPFRYTYIDINGAYHVMAGKKYVHDTYAAVAKMDNGYLTFAETFEDETDLKSLSEKVTGFKEALEKKNISFLYVQDLEKACRYDKDAVLPTGVYTGSPDVQPLLSELEKNNVDHIDLEERLHNDGLDHYGMFFKTDHHWTVEAGFWANAVICEHLEDKGLLKTEKELLDKNSYVSEKYENAFIGAQGTRVGKVFSPVDDFEFINPGFDTDITVISDGVEKRGPFVSSLLDMSCFTEQAELSDKDYVAFSGGDFALQKVINHKNTSGKKIVVIRDSFARVVTPYLALQCSELHIIDLRYFKDMSALEYSESIGADAVIVMYNPSMLPEENAFEFFGIEAE